MKKGNPWALLPILCFLVVFIGMGVWLNDFYAMPAIVGFLIALGVAFCQNRKRSFSEKMEDVTHSMGDSNVMIMCLVFVMAGGFSGAVQAAGGVDSTVNFSLSILPPSVAVAGLFIIGCFISTAMGTSVGTIAALAPIAVGISDKTGIAGALCIGAVVSGAMFGDNLSFISDTTIAACNGQGCEMKDKFKANFFIVLPAAIITVLIFWLATRNMSFQLEENLNYSLWEVLPYMVVLLGALIGINVFVVLISGIVISLIVGVSMGHIALSEMFQVVGSGVTSMYDITVISIIVACIVSLVKEHGGIQFILNLIKSNINGRRGAEFGIALLALFVDACTANNTVAIVMTGPIAKEISEEFDVDPRRSASLLDMFTSVGQGIIPYGAQLLSAATLTGLTPLQIIPNLYYPLLMGVCGILAIIFLPQSRKTTTN